MWTPPNSARRLGQLRKLLPSLSINGRVEEVSLWHSDGGILLMSYEIFRALTLNETRKARPGVLSERVHEKVKSQLLDGPNIIVADEAHRMKNRNSRLAQASIGFRSKSRIALTGSPLANNLADYYAMIDWIAPGYLGDFVQFRAKYVEPIEDGLYADSSSFERRRSLKKLQVLKTDLDPKVNRADISVLEHDLPPKVEFVVTVPLTELQEKAYKLYVAALSAGQDDVGTARIWDWLAVLSLLCTHPTCFMNKLIQRQQNASGDPKSSSPDTDLEKVPGDAPISQVLSSELITELKGIFHHFSNVESLELSHRCTIINQIISHSISAGDKVLVFSHSIPSLDYVERVLKRENREYCRLDGQTPISSRQTATKSFNQVDSRMQVYLISTRAGGLGLNIPGANRVILVDFNFNPTWEEQAVGRAYRLGQKKPVYVYRFITGGTYEDIIYNKTVFKTQLSSRVVDKKNPIRWASKSAKDYLFDPKPVKQKDISEFKGKDVAVLDKILASQNNIRAIALTETFQREDNDKLTPEEEKDVQEELADERLKRNDPAAWQRKNQEKAMRESVARSYVPPSQVDPYLNITSIKTQPLPPNPTPPVAPPYTSIYTTNIRPPALKPDQSLRVDASISAGDPGSTVPLPGAPVLAQQNASEPKTGLASSETNSGLSSRTEQSHESDGNESLVSPEHLNKITDPQNEKTAQRSPLRVLEGQAREKSPPSARRDPSKPMCSQQ